MKMKLTKSNYRCNIYRLLHIFVFVKINIEKSYVSVYLSYIKYLCKKYVFIQSIIFTNIFGKNYIYFFLKYNKKNIFR